jgi:chaperonin GroES
MLVPKGANVVVKKTDLGEKSQGGIVLPESSRADSQEGLVLAIGPDVREREMVGQRIIFNKYSGSDVKVDGELYLLIAERDIIAAVCDDYEDLGEIGKSVIAEHAVTWSGR